MLKQYEVKRLRQEALIDLRDAFKSNRDQIKSCKKYFVSLPSYEGHENTHLIGREAGMAQKIHSVIVDKIKELVRGGITDVRAVRQFLRLHVQTHFKDASPDDRALLPNDNRHPEPY